MRFGVSFAATNKDRLLNATLLGAVALLVISFTHSTISNNTGQPGTTDYANSSLVPLSAKPLPSYNPLPMVNPDGTVAQEPATQLPVLQSILSPKLRVQPSPLSSATLSPTPVPLSLSQALQATGQLPLVGQPLSQTVNQVTVPVEGVLDSAVPTVGSFLR